MAEGLREIAGREAAKLYFEQIRDVKNLIARVEEDLGKDIASISKDQWEQMQKDLGKTIEALSGLKEMGMLVQEQKTLLNKLEAQQEHIRDRVLPEFEKEAARKVAS